MESKTYSPLDCLKILLQETVLNHHDPDYNREIDYSTAEFIWSIPEHKDYCYVQTQDRFGSKLKYPVLWSVTGWRNNIESWRQAKLREDAERDARFVFQENHKRVVKALAKELTVLGDPANAYAYSKLKKLPVTHPFFVDFLQVKLITNVSEIP